MEKKLSSAERIKATGRGGVGAQGGHQQTKAVKEGSKVPLKPF